jgi:osmotically-inducible protein OsmY
MSNDHKLQQAVLDALGWEPSVTAAHIGVAADHGVVTLTGHVDSYAEKHAAEEATLRVKHVHAIADEIEVRIPFETSRTDDQIAAAAIDRLAWDVAVNRNAISVRVENGWVTLTGEVDWHYQKEAAGQAIRRLMGVTGVSNQVTIKPSINAATVSGDIADALDRSWFSDPQTITVKADGGKIRLGGTVHSPQERQIALDAAWAAPGVTIVENAIRLI